MKNVIMIIFLIICVGILVGMFFVSGNTSNNENTTNNTNSNNVVYENNIIDNTNTENRVLENKAENIVENVNTTETTNVSNTEVTNTASNDSNESEETTVDYDDSNDKEIAISLAEKEWGEDETVYYTNEGVKDGKYVVAVRDKSDTSVKLYYKVDINSSSVEIEW